MINELNTQIELDKLDRSILQVLQKNADVTNAQLGELVNASVATCQRRVAQLKQLGVIRKEVAIVDPSLVGNPVLAICEVTMETQTHEALSGFENMISVPDEVQQCYRVSAGSDFVLVLVLPDMDGYQTFVGSYLTARQGIRNVRTFFSTYRSKFETALPLT